MPLNYVGSTRTAQLDAHVDALKAGNDKFVIDENFELIPQVASYAAGDKPWYELEGTGAADGDVTSVAGGGIKVEADTSGSNDDEAVLVRGANQSIVWNTIDDVAFLAVIETDATITNLQYKFGMASNAAGNGIAAGADGSNVSDFGDVEAVFTFDTDDSDTTWQVSHIVTATAEVEVDTGVTVVAATKYVLHVTIDTDQMAAYFINGLEVYRATAALTASSSGSDLGPHLGVSRLDAGDRYFHLRRCVVSKNFND